MDSGETDEPVTPAGRLFLRPEMNQIITCVAGQKNPIDVDAVKAEITKSVMITLPRFTSLMVRDRNGLEHWRKTQVDVDRHVIVRHEPVVDGVSDEDAVNDYLADLAVSTPLSFDKPLWEIHLLMAHKGTILRVHHALGDGISLMSLFLACCRRADDPDQPLTIKPLGTSSSSTNHHRREWVVLRVLRFVQLAWFSLVFILEFVFRSLWVRDKRTAVSGGDGVELWPRKLATARFQLDDMKTVKKAIADATINDVLFGIVSSGLSKYLDIRSPKGLKEGLQITGLAMVNLRSQPGLQDVSALMARNSGSRWGNQFGMLLLPVYYHKDGADPLQCVKRAKKMLDMKKQSLEAHFSYNVGNFVMSFLGAKYASLLNYRIVCNTTFTISNVVGPQEEIALVGNPINYIRANTCSLPHAITMHMTSYAGRADMQILVAKEIIPDPEVLAKCFEDALFELKEAAEAASKT
ncbi:wax ester synthase/diacylglycerol acyltransferase 11-like [Cornus florida]|uniref:wax ester synthase/diacylglycerol acyltransferase 11-like n=1 Tax=Cornus florida TaxID=4283 RepID=UPI0028A2334E|nr:wax ester synthase/diacylglycerol acyltransferase 11-like [Cornus florida]